MASRRTFLKTAGVAAVGSLAGCLGDDDDADLDEMNLAIPPLGVNLLTLSVMEDEGTIQEQEEELGIEYNVQETWDMVPLFAGGQTHCVPTVSTPEAAVMGNERDMEIVAHGQCLAQYTAIIVEEGSEFDPEVAGSQEQAYHNLAEDGVFGIGTWGLGHIPQDNFIIHEVTDGELSFQQDDNDFNVQIADYNSLPTLLAQGDLDAIGSGPLVDADSLNYSRETGEMDGYTMIHHVPTMLDELGYNRASTPLGSWLTTAEFSENHRDALRGFMQAWQDGVDAMYDRPEDELVGLAADFANEMGAANEEAAMDAWEWSFNSNPRVVMEDVEITDDIVSSDEEILDGMEDIGQIPSPWNDFITYDPIEL